MLHRVVRWGLGLHGLFHILDFGINLIEGAWVSALFTFIGALFMFGGALIHHKEGENG